MASDRIFLREAVRPEQKQTGQKYTYGHQNDWKTTEPNMFEIHMHIRPDRKP